MSKIYDVTITMHNDMPSFPGDEKFYEISDVMLVEEGKPYTIRKLKMLTHTGTHIDAPSHFIPHGTTMDQLDLSKFIGKAYVYEIKNDKKITIEEIKDFHFEENTIVLFKTRNSKLWKEGKQFDPDYVYVTPEVAQFLVNQKVKTVGIDYLSIDPCEEGIKPETHHILLGNNIPIVEGLDLLEVQPGVYRFTGLPLKIPGADGSPIRAILEEL